MKFRKLLSVALVGFLTMASAQPAQAVALPLADVAFTKLSNIPQGFNPQQTVYNAWASGQTLDASDDGSYLIAADGYAYNGGNAFNATGRKVFISSNGGSSWVDSGLPDGEWGPVSVSGDGRYMLAASYGNNGTQSTTDDGRLFVSSNYGVSWTEKTPQGGQRYFWDAKISRDGSTMIASSDHTNIPLISTDSGATWAEMTGFTAGAWRDLAISSDGTVVAVCKNDGAAQGRARIFVSRSNTKSHTWSNFTESVDRSAGICGSMDMNDAGTLLLAMSWSTEPIDIFRYSNSAWSAPTSVTTTTGAQSTVGWTNGIAVSGDGSKIIMGGWDQDDDLISVDGGQTWKVHQISQLSTKVGLTTVSKDGTKFFTMATDGFYMSPSAPNQSQAQNQNQNQSQSSSSLVSAPALKGLESKASFEVGSVGRIVLRIEDFDGNSSISLNGVKLSTSFDKSGRVEVELPATLAVGRYDLVIKTNAGTLIFLEAVKVNSVKVSTASIPSIKSITCVKGSVTKKISGPAPKCPKGFKVKIKK